MRAGPSMASCVFRGRAAAISVVLASGLLSVACASSPPSPPVPVPPPTDVALSVGSAFDANLTWTCACVDCRIELQARATGGEWTVVENWVPASSPGYGFLLDRNGPELSQIRFRLRAVSDTNPPRNSEWSAELEFVYPIRTPGGPAVQGPGPTSPISWLDVSWSNSSEVADTLEVERGTPGAPYEILWTPLAIPFGQTSFRDETVIELVPYVYRVRYGTGGTWSPWAQAGSVPPLRQPSGARATVGPEGVEVTWSNWSAAATGVVVSSSRAPSYPFRPAPLLPPDATAWIDPVWPPWPTTAYAVEATTSPTASMPSGGLPVAKLDPFRLSGPVATLDARADGFPVSPEARDEAGAFHGVAFTAGLAIWRQVDGSWEAHSVGYPDAVVEPRLKLDGAGHPHAMVHTTPAPGLTTLTHHWYDGTSWLEEEIGPLPMYFSTARWALDGDGRVHVLYMQDAPSQLVHGIETGSVWSWVPVPGLPPDTSTLFAVAQDGTAYVESGGLLATLPPGGVWSTDPIPSGLQGSIVPGPGGRVAIIGTDTFVGPQRTWFYVERDGVAWGTPEPVVQVEMGEGLPHAASPDGTRLFVLANVLDADARPQRLDLFLRQDGIWSSMPLVGAPTGGSDLALGYGPAGKLWIESAGSLWEEP